MVWYGMVWYGTVWYVILCYVMYVCMPVYISYIYIYIHTISCMQYCHPCCHFAGGKAQRAPHQDGLDLRSACRDAPKDGGVAGLSGAGGASHMQVNSY